MSKVTIKDQCFKILWHQDKQITLYHKMINILSTRDEAQMTTLTSNDGTPISPYLYQIRKMYLKCTCKYSSSHYSLLFSTYNHPRYQCIKYSINQLSFQTSKSSYVHSNQLVNYKTVIYPLSSIYHMTFHHRSELN